MNLINCWEILCSNIVTCSVKSSLFKYEAKLGNGQQKVKLSEFKGNVIE